jgi:DNA-binding NarL/FixJ family response regulator
MSSVFLEKMLNNFWMATYHQERPDSATDVLLRGWKTSVSGYSALFGKQGSFKKYEQVAKLSCYGLSSRAIADVLELDQRTVETVHQ